MKRSRFIIYCGVILCALLLSACGKTNAIPDCPREIEGLTFKERAGLQYADQFAVDRYEDGFSIIYTPQTTYMIVPEDKEIPKNLGDIKAIKQPLGDVYLAATAAMGFFDALGEGDAIRFSATRAEDWYIDYAKQAMENGDMLYAGKYREPDYELLLSKGCKLSIQSTMIEHSPDVKEKLEELGIPVFIDYSSYESHPLARCEWIKVYGEMLGKQEEAERLFKEQTKYLSSINTSKTTGKTAVFFYINSSGQAVTRRSGDYVTKMIELAGGENVFKNLGEGKTSSSVTVEMEDFYSAAKDADFIIYNSTIGGEIGSVDEIIVKNSLLADFKAVQNGDVWCTHDNLFQEIMKTGAIISNFNAIFQETTDDRAPRYLYKVKDGGADD